MESDGKRCTLFANAVEEGIQLLKFPVQLT